MLLLAQLAVRRDRLAQATDLEVAARLSATSTGRLEYTQPSTSRTSGRAAAGAAEASAPVLHDRGREASAGRGARPRAAGLRVGALRPAEHLDRPASAR